MTESTLRRLVFVLVGLSALSVGLREVSDWDVWWQLRTANDALATGSTLPTDTMSYSVTGARWAHKDLGGYLPLYWAHGLGPLALCALLALVAMVGPAALWRLVPPERRDPVLFLVASNLWLAAVQSRVVPRAQVFSISLFVVMYVLLEGARRAADSPARFSRYLGGAVVLSWIWLNLHRGGIHGLILMGGFGLFLVLRCAVSRSAALDARLGPLLGPTPHPLSTLLAVLALPTAVAVGCLNPSGFALYSTGFAVTGDGTLLARVSEWQPLSFQIATSTYPVATVLLVAAPVAIVVALLRAARSGAPGVVSVWHLGVWGVFAFQGASSARFLTDSASAATVPLLVLAASLAIPWPRSPTLVLGLGLALPVGASALNNMSLGVGSPTDRYPVEAMDFARREGLGPRVHNAFVYGGYVLWAGRDPSNPFRTLIDGRNDMVYSTAFYLECVDAQRDPALFAELQRTHPSDWVLAENTPGRETFAFLARDPAWALVFASEAAVVYVRRADGALDPARLDALAYRWLRPGAEVQGLVAGLHAAGDDPGSLSRLEGELKRFQAQAPHAFRPRALSLVFLHLRGRTQERDLALEALIALHPEHPGLNGLLALLARVPRPE